MDHGDPNAPSSPPPSFEETISSFFLCLEETRRLLPPPPSSSTASTPAESQPIISLPHLHDIHHRTVTIHSLLQSLTQSNSNEDENNYHIQQSMIQNCHSKFLQLLSSIISLTTTTTPVIDYGCDGQPLMAHFFEWACVYSNDNSSSKATAWETDYATYQKKVLRQRCKPSIATLVKYRREASQAGESFVVFLSQQNRNDTTTTPGQADDEDPHALHSRAVMILLAEASNLMEPLSQWSHCLPPISSPTSTPLTNKLQHLCQNAISTLFEETTNVTQRLVGEWFKSDVQLDEWIKKGQGRREGLEQQRRRRRRRQHYYESPTSDDDYNNVDGLDDTVNELAFLCHVLARYDEFYTTVVTIPSSTPPIIHPLKLLLTELSGTYSLLEDYLLSVSFERALDLATPVEIFDNVLVPSIVEDAFYLSRRCVERSHSTRDVAAIVTVLNRVVELWNAGGWESGDKGGEEEDERGGSSEGVCNGLREGLKGSCVEVMEEEHDNDDEGRHDATKNRSTNGHGSTTTTTTTQSDNSNKFAAALVGAIDDEDKIQSPPHSNNSFTLLSTSLSLYSSRSRLYSRICVLNGIASASSACIALSHLLSDILHDESSSESALSKMLVVTSEELYMHSQSYRRELSRRSHGLVEETCQFLYHVTEGICRRDYHSLDGMAFGRLMAEGNQEVLERELLGGMMEDELVRVMRRGRCDFMVILELSEILSKTLSSTLLTSILSPPKPFSDYGTLLFSKQVRLLQDTLCDVVHRSEDKHYSSSSAAASSRETNGETYSDSNVNDGERRATNVILDEFAKVRLAVTILGLEKPGDWVMLGYNRDNRRLRREVPKQQGRRQGGDGDGTTKKEDEEVLLTREEVEGVMNLRVDFGEEAVMKACRGSC